MEDTNDRYRYILYVWAPVYTHLAETTPKWPLIDDVDDSKKKVEKVSTRVVTKSNNKGFKISSFDFFDVSVLLFAH